MTPVMASPVRKKGFSSRSWIVEPRANRLVQADTRLKLDPKVMQALLYLAERPNEVAVKEEIIESVWAGAFCWR
ncbi:MAG TPA: hypothetical protein VEK15_01100 [Vicinamibacteria bacterium]|nr:hypothetical protein [Vicinamibacteria bacterium]